MRMYKDYLVAFVMAILFAAVARGGVLPFYENMQTEAGSFFAIRPFYSHTVLEEGEVQDWLWPLYSRKSFKEEQSSRALIFYFTHQFDVSEETPRSRRWLFPFYFQGRDVNDESYFAVFPFGGTIHEFLGRDKIAFALFPLYGKSQINEVQTTSILWPIGSHTRGDGIQRDRIFPIAGRSVLEGQYRKKFVLWPFWTSVDYYYPGNAGKTWMLFPVCGWTNLEQEKTVWVVPPLFRFTKGEQENRVNCPWPFFQKIDSEMHDRLYFWPLWGQDRYANRCYQKNFMLWPFLWSSTAVRVDVTKTTKKVIPFFFTESEFRNEEGVALEDQEKVSNYWKVWPLMSWQRDETASRFRFLELWPLKNSRPIERNWAPLWTLYQRTEVQGTVHKDLLWFTWSSERAVAEDRSEWSLLKGLLSYKKEGDQKRFQVLYFLKFGK